MDAANLVSEIIGILVSGITELASGLGTGIESLVTGFFLTGEGSTQTLSTFGVVTCIFAGIALCIGLSRLILHWISTLGSSRV